MEKTQEVFFELVKAGLWEKSVCLAPYGMVDFDSVLGLAEEQTVVGLVTAGLEQVKDIKVPQVSILQFIGQTVQLEQRNKAMNDLIAELVAKMREAGIYTLLVKGQGIAQCYEKPLWRACGDVDFFLSDENYQKAKAFLLPLSSIQKPEGKREKHLGLNINDWVVELHGRLYGGLSNRIEKILDELQKDTFYGGNVRSWNNNGVQVFMLGVENDVFYVFTHIMQHFYKGGIGIRQICDWCRLLWTYRETLQILKLGNMVKAARLLSEWKTFGAFAVEYLGMPIEAMPLYSADKRWQRKAKRIKDFILMSGNFGHNRDNSYFEKYSYVIRKCISMGRRISDLFRHTMIFPLDSLRFFPNMMFNGLKSAANGE